LGAGIGWDALRPPGDDEHGRREEGVAKRGEEGV